MQRLQDGWGALPRADDSAQSIGAVTRVAEMVSGRSGDLYHAGVGDDRTVLGTAEEQWGNRRRWRLDRDPTALSCRRFDGLRQEGSRFDGMVG